MTGNCGVELPLRLQVNGRPHALSVSRGASLLQVLRNDLQLNGPKYGCGLGQCGACTVHVDGVAARACVIPAHGVAGREITTLEGLPEVAAAAGLAVPRPPALAATPDAADQAVVAQWHPVQAAFEQAQAAQCGYCLNGMVMQAAALLARDADVDEARIRSELSGNLCRCGTHIEILDAVQRAARHLRAAITPSGAGRA